MKLDVKTMELKKEIIDQLFKHINNTLSGGRVVPEYIFVRHNIDLKDMEFFDQDPEIIFNKYNIEVKSEIKGIIENIIKKFEAEIPNISDYLAHCNLILNDDGNYYIGIMFKIKVTDITEIGNPEFGGFKLDSVYEGKLIGNTNAELFHFIGENIIEKIMFLKDYHKSTGLSLTIDLNTLMTNNFASYPIYGDDNVIYWHIINHISPGAINTVMSYIQTVIATEDDEIRSEVDYNNDRMIINFDTNEDD